MYLSTQYENVIMKPSFPSNVVTSMIMSMKVMNGMTTALVMNILIPGMPLELMLLEI